MEPRTSHAGRDPDHHFDPDLCHNLNPEALSPAAAFSAKLLRAFEYFRNPPSKVPELERCYLLADDLEGWDLLPICYVRGRIRNHLAPLPNTLEESLQNCSCLINGPELFYTDVDHLLATFWAKFHAISIEYACHEAPKGTPLPEIRQFLYDPLEYYFLSRELGELVIEQPGHWVGVISDPSIHGPRIRDTPAPERQEYVLINEILACIALIFRQINDPVWAPALTPKLESWKFTGEGQIVKATIVSFTNNFARVVQASCDLTSPSPELVLSVAADICMQGMWTDFNVDTSREIARWIIQPDDPDAPTPSISQYPFPVVSGNDGRRVPSGSSDGSRESKYSSAMARSSTNDSVSSAESTLDASESRASASKSADPTEETSIMAESTMSMGQTSDDTMEVSSAEAEPSVSVAHTPGG